MVQIMKMKFLIRLNPDFRPAVEVWRSSLLYAADPCSCTHPRSMHSADGGCLACACDAPATIIQPFAA